jgi:hypothetical protein
MHLYGMVYIYTKFPENWSTYVKLIHGKMRTYIRFIYLREESRLKQESTFYIVFFWLAGTDVSDADTASFFTYFLNKKAVQAC